MRKAGLFVVGRMFGLAAAVAVRAKQASEDIVETDATGWGARIARIARIARNLANATNHAGAGHVNFLGNAGANLTGGLVVDPFENVDFVLLADILGHALANAPHGGYVGLNAFADRHYGFNGLLEANPLANLDRAALELRAIDPNLVGVAAGVGGLATRIGGGSARVAEQAAQQGFPGFPVPEGNQMPLLLDFLDGLVARLHRRALLHDGHELANLASLGRLNDNDLDHGAGPLTDLGNALPFAGIVFFGPANDLVGSFLGDIRFGNAFGDGPHSGTTVCCCGNWYWNWCWYNGIIGPRG